LISEEGRKIGGLCFIRRHEYTEGNTHVTIEATKGRRDYSTLKKDLLFN
jgi:hypothetical protein